MSFRGSLTEELDKWLQEEGIPATSRKGIPFQKIEPRVRQAKLEILFTRLQELGATREFFYGSNRDEIAEACIPHKKSLRPKDWRELRYYAWRDIDRVRVKIFGTPDGTREAPVVKKSKEELDIRQQLDEESEIKVYSAPEPREESKKAKEFDRSKVKDREPSRFVIDPELEDLLGNK
ncbi:MAG TPA: hypothetical protein VN855_00015 [Candidatus Acidoferrum sp.]|nr:hypothetical protein [Candidatus Acidoferrum sp.]